MIKVETSLPKLIASLEAGSTQPISTALLRHAVIDVWLPLAYGTHYQEGLEGLPWTFTN